MINNNPIQLYPYDPMSQQKTFRLLMQAFSYPGRVVNLSHLSNPLLGVLATLVDNAVLLHDATRALDPDVFLKLELKNASVDDAQFILANGSDAPSFKPKLGSLEEPEGGATVILQVDGFERVETPMILNGPGIATQHILHVQGLHPEWLKHRREWNLGFPMGVDLILISQDAIVAWPRTLQIKTEASWAM
jgi:alpha-D-ribose 1-methylphosphonate 5-triphosphate synthase subunit PhnH